MIQQIESLHSDLELALAINMEATEDAGVDVSDTWSTELVAVSVAEVRRQNPPEAGMAAAVIGSCPAIWP